MKAFAARAVFALVVAAAASGTGACSKSKAPESAKAGDGSAATAPADKPSQGAEHHEMNNLPPEVSKFHDVLAPRWHAEKGPQRMKDTCAAVPEMTTNAAAVAKTTAPDGKDPAVWSAATKELVDAVANLKVSCDANDAAGFEPAFERVHHGFHGLMGAHEGHEAKR